MVHIAARISWDVPQTIQPRWRQGQEPVLWFPAHTQKNKKSHEIPLCQWMDELLKRTPDEKRNGWIFHPMSIE
jgi:hypothetical protein